MTTEKVYAPPASFSESARIQNMEQYQEMYDRSIQDPEGFWAEIAEEFHWHKKWDKVREYDWDTHHTIKWFLGAQTNITYNALDRHMHAGRGDKVAMLWEGIDWRRPDWGAPPARVG